MQQEAPDAASSYGTKRLSKEETRAKDSATLQLPVRRRGSISGGHHEAGLISHLPPCDRTLFNSPGDRHLDGETTWAGTGDRNGSVDFKNFFIAFV